LHRCGVVEGGYNSTGAKATTKPIFPVRKIDLLGETAGDLFARRKATGCLLRERQSAVDSNFEDAATRPPQAQLRRGLQLGDQFPRLTGARFIASLAAVFDLDLHEFVLAT
jgi:hypothetical protein